MKFTFRSLLALLLVGGGALACADSPTTTTVLSPQAMSPHFARIKATDSMMVVTEVTFSDTSLVLKRLSPLATDVSVTAVIGPDGGSIVLHSTGGKIDIPPGALAQDTEITMTAVAGDNVAYEFTPHGLVFNAPVKLQQTIKGTWAEKYPALLKDMHGSYYDQATLDSAFVDRGKFFARVAESQIGYFESNASQLKFYIGHFSGYLVSCGFTDFE